MLRNRINHLVLYLVLALPVLWLAAGIALYLQGNINQSNWQNVFFLRDSPLLSVVLLVALIAIYWMTTNHHWDKLLGWLEEFKSLNRITQATIILSLTFYISLLVTALLFPRLTGYSFQSDWSLLVVATIPLIALVLLILIERATSVKAKFAGIEVEFQRTITTPISQTVTLEQGIVSKGFAYELRRIIEDIQSRQEFPRILVVRFSRHRNQMRIDFVALRDYVYQLSKIAPLEYIVFVDEDDEYLGFMTVEKFKAKYPKFGIESLLEDLERDERTYRMWERFFRVPLPELRETLDRVRSELVLPLWDPQRDRREITERDVTRLGATRLYLQRPTVIEAYRQMIENKVSGIPVVDDRQRFLGIANKDKIIQEVINQLLEKAQV